MGLGRLQFLLVQKLGLKARYLMKVCRCMFPLLRIGRVESHEVNTQYAGN